LANFFILKRLAFHHVTPVAGRIADAQKNRFVFRARFGESFIAPREPIHGIVRMLQQVRRFFAGETIHFSKHKRGAVKAKVFNHGWTPMNTDKKL
jgi:hypothetical protein